MSRRVIPTELQVESAACAHALRALEVAGVEGDAAGEVADRVAEDALARLNAAIAVELDKALTRRD